MQKTVRESESRALSNVLLVVGISGSEQEEKALEIPFRGADLKLSKWAMLKI